MTKKDKNNPHGFVRTNFCDERFKRVETMYSNIEEKLEEISEKNKAWKSWSLGIVASIITGIVLYGLTTIG